MRTAHPHTRFRRLTAVVWALLFLLTGAAEGFGSHVCAHHDPQLAAFAAQAGQSDAAHAAHATAVAVGHAEQQAEQPTDAGCTCIGACQVGGAVLLPQVAFGVATLLAPSAPMSARVAAHDERLPGRTPHTLPYAQAPPALS